MPICARAGGPTTRHRPAATSKRCNRFIVELLFEQRRRQGGILERRMAGECPKIIRSAEAKQSAQKTLVAKKKMAPFALSGRDRANWQKRKNLFVGQCDNRIVTCGTQRRIDGADRGADESQQRGRKDPLRGNQNHEAGICLLQDGLKGKRQRNSQNASANGKKE